MKNRRPIIVLGACGLLAACAREQPPPTVAEFMEDPILLEAAMVRCGQNRSSTKYEPECVNARDAVNRFARAEEEKRRAEFEAESERKRRTLRRTQEAAAEARRRAEEAERLRQEQDYLLQFGTEPGAERPAPTSPTDAAPAVPSAEPPLQTGATAPGATPAAGEGQDLQSIRDELQRRQESDPR
ncbi:MAG: EexN family lipoprotein [Gammaproteobacteria bacterium]|nr:EexN family lipoprotein [Gammaproteobacteria bacterium]MDH4255432.1 EexN family lipoprotein [Gammaproteobacteria bacterium]MDH5308782.1 EexN family lipoprotein [Gammaproteobacteria bacterium]